MIFCMELKKMRNVIIVGVHRGMSEVEPLDIKQMCGRSGRVGLDPKGDAHVLLPQSKLTRYKSWCQNIPPISSTMNDPNVLAFHIVSEISEGEVYDVETLMSWYNRSLAAFQNNFLDRVDAEALLTKLEKYKILEKQGNRYKITKLGRVASYLYYSPYTISGWYFNFSRIFNDNRLDDHSISWALSNIPDNQDNFAGRDMQNTIKAFVTSCSNRGLVITDACASIGVLFHACLTFSEEIHEYQKRTVKFDIERTCTALDMIDKMYSHWNKSDFFKKLQMRIQYEVTEEQTELCTLKGIGGVRVKSLFNEGIKTIIDFKRKAAVAKDVLGDDLYEKIVYMNNL
jgi:helicase